MNDTAQQQQPSTNGISIDMLHPRDALRYARTLIEYSADFRSWYTREQLALMRAAINYLDDVPRHG